MQYSMKTEKQKILLDRIRSLGRLLTEEEIVDHYLQYHTTGTCKTIIGANGLRSIEDSYWEIKNKAFNCYTRTLGRLVISGEFVLRRRCVHCGRPASMKSCAGRLYCDLCADEMIDMHGTIFTKLK